MDESDQVPEQTPDGRGLRVVVVASRWHPVVTDGLLAGALAVLAAAGVPVPPVLRVPDAFELPVAASVAARSGADAVVALGVVVRGTTPHFDYICQGVTAGLTQVAVETRVPIGFGVLTCDNEGQARDRAGLHGSHEDKGGEAARTALETALALRDFVAAAL